MSVSKSFVMLDDDDVARLSDMPSLVGVMESALREQAAGTFISPARHQVAFGSYGKLVFTIGGSVGDEALAGFRVYETFKGHHHSQIVAVWDSASARLLGLVEGVLLGALRTGAIGGVAIKHMAAPDAEVIAVIGSGLQARTQLLAAAAVRRPREVRIYSRTARHRVAFAAEMASELGCNVRHENSPEDAVESADIVLCATSSTTPVLQAAWLKPNAHVNTVGPKTVSGHEIGVDVADAATVIATDSIAQTAAYAEPFFLDKTAHMSGLIDLADLVASSSPARPHGISLFCSTGLAGTEVLAAAHLLRRAQPDQGVRP